MTQKEHIEINKHGNVKMHLINIKGKRVQYIKRLLGYHKSASSFIFDCSTDRGEPITVRLDICSDEIIRLRMVANGDIVYKKTAMVVKQSWEEVPVKIQEESDYLTIETKKLTIKIDKIPWRVALYDNKNRLVCQETTATLHLQSPMRDRRWHRYALGFSKDTTGRIRVFESICIAPNEHFYGFGEKFSRLDKRGQKMICWSEDPGVFFGEGDNTEMTYINVPFFMSTKGYGIFVNSSFKITFDMGNQFFDSYVFEIDDHLMDYYLIYGPTFKEILHRYTEITGKAPVPPKWSFGLWMSRAVGYKDRKELEEVCSKLRANDIPCDVINQDPLWMRKGHLCDFEWDKTAFPDPKGMIAGLRKKGFRLCLWESPYISDKTEMFREGVEKGYFVTNKDGSVYKLKDFPWIFGVCAIVDFSNPAAVEWYQKKHRKLLEIGVATFKTDFGESAPMEGLYHNGMSGEEMHNLFPLLYNKTVFEAIDEYTEGKGLVWGRSGYAGTQRYPINWSGDPKTTFHDMASVLRGGLSIGLSGIPFWSHDIGGFHGKPSSILYVRWAQFGLFSSHVRCHGYGHREPWVFGQETLSIFRKYAKLRYRLIPYMYSYAHVSSQTGLPIIRAMVLECQDDPNVYDKDLQYFFGEELLIAPIFDATGQRDIYLPRGRWVDYWTKEEHEGPTNIRYDAALDILPIFVKANAIIPMGPDMNYVGERPFNPVVLDIYCRSEAEFVLYDDDEVVTFRCQKKSNETILTISESERSYILQFNNVECPKEVTISGRLLRRLHSKEEFQEMRQGWWWHKERGKGKVLIKILHAEEIHLKMAQ